MKVRCPHCEANLKVADEHRGRTGPCPRCGGAVLLEPSDGTSPAVQANPRPAHAEAASLAGSKPVANTAPNADLGILPFADGVPATALAPGEKYPAVVRGTENASSLPALPRAGTVEPPKKSARAKLREIADIKREGNRFLLRIRVLLLGLGLLMLAYNAYRFVTIEGTVAAFKVQATSNQSARADRANAERSANTLRMTLRLQSVIYVLLGVALCALAGPIYKAPVICAWAALATFCTTCIFELLSIEAMFGESEVSRVVFSLGTPIKLVIIGGLWYGVLVATAYEDQVFIPMIELIREELGESGGSGSLPNNE